MSLTSDVLAFGAGSAVQNHVTAPIATIRSLANSFNIITAQFATAGDCYTDLNNYASYVETTHGAIVNKMPLALPLMQSVYAVDLRLGSSTAEQSFPAYFDGLTNAEAKTTSVRDSAQTCYNTVVSTVLTISGVTGTGDAALTSFMSVAPAVGTPEYTTFSSTYSTQLSTIQSSLTSLKSTVETDTTDVTSLYNGINSAYSDGLNKLKGVSFIQFLNATHPAPVQTAINNNITLSAVPVLP
ncbi:MAG TPA: hypothetical protein VFM18_05310 [Methanosarcina sp.]|nr:hypothetical protein [Methanosarcina sp.]